MLRHQTECAPREAPFGTCRETRIIVEAIEGQHLTAKGHHALPDPPPAVRTETAGMAVTSGLYGSSESFGNGARPTTIRPV